MTWPHSSWPSEVSCSQPVDCLAESGLVTYHPHPRESWWWAGERGRNALGSMAESIINLIESRLRGFDEHLGQALRLDRGHVPDRLFAAMEYSLLAGGKRIRPLLTFLACEAVSADARAALPAAVSIELIHTYSLIHDDLPAMDDDDLRRGRPTCHKQFDEATAILAGDGLLTLAFQHIVVEGKRAGLSDHARVASVECLASAAGPAGMVGGQMADLEAETADDIAVGQLTAIHERKTGRLLAAAAVLGGIAGGANDDQLKRLDRYGRHVGLAFQIADDLLDETGDAGTIGKSVRKDSARGKATFPGLLGLDESRARANDLLNSATEAIAGFGPAAEPLIELGRFIVERDR